MLYLNLNNENWHLVTESDSQEPQLIDINQELDELLTDRQSSFPMENDISYTN